MQRGLQAVTRIETPRELKANVLGLLSKKMFQKNSTRTPLTISYNKELRKVGGTGRAVERSGFKFPVSFRWSPHPSLLPVVPYPLSPGGGRRQWWRRVGMREVDWVEGEAWRRRGKSEVWERQYGVVH
jgi:hypothetical protein